ncbi:MAG: flagellar biosynthetic protein FliR [Phycisphaerales bacterium]|jgi:flagellar biosynthetic protein FliR|nr:flagellar biosynthetic protein FliR [Phycisphaerales bacterium]
MTPTIFSSLSALLLVIARISGLVVTAPVLSSTAIPKTIRIAISLALGFAVWTCIPAASVASQSGVGLAILLGIEFAVGATIGFLMNIPLIACQMGGTLMGQQMSIALPSMLDPASGDRTDILGQGFMMFAVVLFVLVGGVEQMFSATVSSFSHFSGTLLLEEGFLISLGGMLDSAFEFSLRMALPILAVLLLQTAALAVVARSMPQLNIFSVGLPLRILVGFLVLSGGVVGIGKAIETYLPMSIEHVSTVGGVI